jgi:putative nucleotidyltransferase with HDIG domain
MDKADSYLDRVIGLPLAPIATTQLLNLLDEPEQDLDQVGALLREEPSLTWKILKWRGCASLGANEPARCNLEVVHRLGFEEVYRLVAVLVTASTFLQVKTSGGLNVDKLWSHSLSSAVAAATIASCIHESENTAFTAGLLHDIGKLIFVAVEGPKYGELLRLHGDCGRKLRRAEQMVFGVDHPALGARLLSRWGLPENIVSTVSQHHTAASLDGSAHQRLVITLKLANNLAYLIALEDAHICDPAQCIPGGITVLGLTAVDIPNLVEQVEVRLRGVQRFSKLSFGQPAHAINMPT